MKSLLLISTSLAFLTASLSAQFVQNWQFSDAAGTDLNDALNSGTIGTPWNFSLGTNPDGATNGTGQFIVGFSAAAGSGALTEDYTRKAETPAWSVSTGTYTFEFRISDWDMSGTASDNGTDGTNDREGIKFKIESSSGAQAVTTFELNNGDIRSRHASGGSATTTTQGNAITMPTTAGGTDLIVRIEGDLGTGAWGTSYNYNNTGFTSIVTDGAGITDIASIIMTAEWGTTSTWATNDFIAVDYVTLEAVPEPATYALALGIAALGLIVIRRRRQLG